MKEELANEYNQNSQEIVKWGGKGPKKNSSWKPINTKQSTKPSIKLTIVEELQAVLYDKQNVQDFSYLSGISFIFLSIFNLFFIFIIFYFIF